MDGCRCRLRLLVRSLGGPGLRGSAEAGHVAVGGRLRATDQRPRGRGTTMTLGWCDPVGGGRRDLAVAHRRPPDRRMPRRLSRWRLSRHWLPRRRRSLLALLPGRAPGCRPDPRGLPRAGAWARNVPVAVTVQRPTPLSWSHAMASPFCYQPGGDEVSSSSSCGRGKRTRRWESLVLLGLLFSDGASIARLTPSGATPDFRQPAPTPSTPRT